MTTPRYITIPEWSARTWNGVFRYAEWKYGIRDTNELIGCRTFRGSHGNLVIKLARD